MSTTGEAIRAALVGATGVTALVAARIYPALMPQSATPGTVTLPAIVYTVIVDTPENILANDSNDRLVNARVQIDSYSKSYLEAHSVDAAVGAALEAASSPSFAIWREVSRELYDNEAQLHRVSSEFSVWR